MSILTATEIEVAATDQSVVLRSALSRALKESNLNDEKSSLAKLESPKPSVSVNYLNSGTDSGYATQSGTPETGCFSTGFALPERKLQLWPRIIKLKVFDEKAIPLLTWKRFHDLNELFSKPLYEHLANSKVRYRALSIKLKVLGPDQSQSKPWIVVQCDKSVTKRVRRFFNQSWIKTEYHPLIPEASCPCFGVLVCAKPPRPIAGDVSIDVFGRPIWSGKSPGCMVITLPMEYGRGHRIATVGGLVKVSMQGNSSQIYGLTAGHVLSKVLYEDSLDDHQAMEAEIGNGGDNEALEPWNTDAELFELDALCQDGTFGKSAFSSSLKSPNTVPLLTRDIDHWPKVGSIARCSKNDPTGGQNLDWALIDINPHFPVELFGSRPGRGIIQTNASSDPRCGGPISMGPDRKVTLMSAMSGVKNGELTTSCSYLMLPPSKGLVKAYTLVLSDGTVLQPGDCGSWVVDSVNGKIYGYVTASDDTFGEVYVIPMEESFKQIKSQLSAECVSFPTAEEVERFVKSGDVIQSSPPAITSGNPRVDSAYWSKDSTPKLSNVSHASPHSPPSPQPRSRSSSTSSFSPSSPMMSQPSPRFGSFSSAPSTGPSPSQSPKSEVRFKTYRTFQYPFLALDSFSFDPANEVPFQPLPSSPAKANSGSISNEARIPSFPEVGPKFSVADALKWKSDRKRAQNTPLPGLFPLEHLKERDHIFLTDNSESMAPYWKEVCETFEAMSYLIKQANGSEMVMHFTNSDDHCKIRATEKPLRMLQTQQLKEPRDGRHPIDKVLDDYHNIAAQSPASSRMKFRPLNLYILTAGENLDLYSLGPNQLEGIENYYRRVFNIDKMILTIRFIIFGFYAKPLDKLQDNDLYLRNGGSITFDIKHSSGNVLQMLGGSANVPVEPAVRPPTKTTDKDPALKFKVSRPSRISGWINSGATMNTGAKQSTEHASAENQTVVGSKVHPSWRSALFWDDLEDDEGLESDEISRHAPIVDRSVIPKQSFGGKLKRKFSVMPIRDGNGCESPEKDRRIRGLRKAIHEGLRAMMLKIDLSSQKSDLGSMNTSNIDPNRRRVRTGVRHWGSDEDLVHDIGFGVDPELRDPAPIPRPAPMAVAGKTQKEEGWNFPIKRGQAMNSTKREKQMDIARAEAAEVAKRQQDQSSLLDVGGLLGGSQTI